MKFVSSRKDKKRDDKKKIEKPVCPTGENEEKHTKKDNNAMMSQGCLN